MIILGETLENPVTGERFTFTDTAASTNGELLGFDFALRAGGTVPIPHVHPVQTERFEVLEGLMRFRIGLRTRLARPGEVVEVARQLRPWRRDSEVGAAARAEAVVARPGLAGMDWGDCGSPERRDRGGILGLPERDAIIRPSDSAFRTGARCGRETA